MKSKNKVDVQIADKKRLKKSFRGNRRIEPSYQRNKPSKNIDK
ncbi:MAG: hypothetical protein HW421_2031 [Ignavibacteria bacterium]|nr:hypothetical protein [Ignavibacteria bacterium]